MSGTIGTTGHRWSSRPVEAVLQHVVQLRRAVVAIRATGGLDPRVAVPLAVLLTGSVIAVTVAVAGSWVS